MGKTYDTGQSNHGTCSDDPEDQATSSLLGRCWGYEVRPGFIREPGGAYFLMRLRSRGTGPRKDEEFDDLVPRDSATCHRWSGEDFAPVDDPGCTAREELPAAEVFGAGQRQQREQPAPSMPRKLLSPPVEAKPGE